VKIKAVKIVLRRRIIIPLTSCDEDLFVLILC
jgi:hypothetical protein